MASMEVHLNRLFRQVGNGTIDELTEREASSLLALQKESVAIVPEAWCDLPQAERATVLAQYRLRALSMVGLLETFLVHLRNRDLDQATEWLEKIDRQRRECHVRFG